MTRSVEDAALMMAVLSQPDDRDPMSLPPPVGLDWHAAPLAPQGLKIGLMVEAGVGLPVDPEIRATVETAAASLSDAGAEIEIVPPFLTRPMLDGLDRFWRQRALVEIEQLEPVLRDRILPYIRAWAEGAIGLTGAEVYEGMNQMLVMRYAVMSASRGFDFVLSPVAPIPAYAAELASPIDDPSQPFEHIGFTVPFNMSEQPAASINAGYTSDGLPIGLQIVGRRFDDIGVLRLSRTLEEIRGPQRPWPRF
jgi:Asp-tRNA(Asn)/Glu-tRNA(Gln) amidotransferase A subunit family amidase